MKRLASRLKSALPEADAAGASQRTCRSGARKEPAIDPCTLLSPSSVAAGRGVPCGKVRVPQGALTCAWLQLVQYRSGP